MRPNSSFVCVHACAYAYMGACVFLPAKHLKDCLILSHSVHNTMSTCVFISMFALQVTDTCPPFETEAPRMQLP